MNTVDFADNLYQGEALRRLGGCGLKAFVRTAFWNYTRHGDGCKPGKWSVLLCCGSESDAFYDLSQGSADAVVDDFGSLVRVQ